MKRIALTLAALLAVSLGSMAQYNEISTPTSKTAQTFSRQKLLGDHPYNFNTGSSSERGHDRLDSLYYLDINTYSMPYYKEKDKKAVVQYILSILVAYDRLMESATGGFKSASPLRFGPIVEESKRLSMYYAEELDPFVIGGKGRNYVVVRHQDPHNSNYRTCEGVEWWLGVPGVNELIIGNSNYYVGNKKKARVYFRVFSLYGPLTEQHYERAFNEHMGALASKAEITSNTPSIRKRDYGEENLIQQIRILAALYKDNGSTTDDAVVHSINDRVTKYLNLSNLFSDKNRQLYRALGKIPGYGASVCYPDGLVATGSFEWLANHYPQATQFEMNWYTKGDAKCTGECRNFLLEINVKKIEARK